MLFRSPLRTLGTVIGTSTYIIPPSIINLDVAQIGTNEWQEEDRMLTGDLDNLCISNINYLGNEGFTVTSSGIQISPNPTSGLLNIKSINNLTSVTIFDNNGRLLQTDQSIQSNEYQTNLDQFSNGIYFIEIVSDKEVSRQKIIKF